ncbi:MAG: hypothetical protein IT514_00890 [Burkholderiales bacterium]|nr:hypothetical protein [Burkholderiales bacterium]
MLSGEGFAQALATHRVHPVRAVRGEVLELDGVSLRVPGLAGWPGPPQAVAAAACSLGPEIEARVSALFKARRPLLALALDELASEKLFRLSERLYARIRREARRSGLETGSPENPGDAVLPIQAQAVVLRLSGMDASAVRADPLGMLRPLKSLAFVVPLGADFPGSALRSRCATCASRETCGYRAR